MTVQFANNAVSALQVGISPTDNHLIVAPADAALFPPAGGTDVFDLVIEDRKVVPPIREICRCYSRSTNNLQVTRGTEGTAALAWAPGVIVSHRITAAGMATLRDDSFYGQRLLGSFGTAPTIRPDGTPLEVGDHYYDTTLRELFVWLPGGWASAANDIAGDTTIGGYLNVGKDAAVDGNLHVLGTAKVDGATTLAGLTVTGTVTATGAVTVQTLTVNGNENVGGVLASATGITTPGYIHAGGSLDAYTLNVGAGGANVNGAFSASSIYTAGNISTPLDIYGRRIIASADVYAYTDIQGTNITARGNLSANGNAGIAGGLSVGVDITAGRNVTGAYGQFNSAHILGPLNVDGAFGAGTSIWSGGAISAVGSINANGNVIAGAALQGAYVHSTGSTQTDGDSVTNGVIYVGGTGGILMFVSNATREIRYTTDGWSSTFDWSSGIFGWFTPGSVANMFLDSVGNLHVHGQVYGGQRAARVAGVLEVEPGNPVSYDAMIEALAARVAALEALLPTQTSRG
jgi:hypothetical protein